MTSFICHLCDEEIANEKPIMFGACYPYFEGETACFKCVDKYDGPEEYTDPKDLEVERICLVAEDKMIEKWRSVTL